MIEDFPTPVSPTRRMVYDLFADVLIIPFLRDSTSLEKDDQRNCVADVAVTYLGKISFSRGSVE